MKKILLIAFMSLGFLGFSQDLKEKAHVIKKELSNQNQADLATKQKGVEEKAKLPKPYNAKANAEKDIQNLVAQAKKEGKHVMIQAGGNWCIWCLRFNQFVQTTPELKDLVDKNYLYYHLNFSPDNKNEKIFAQYGNPGDKFGYPVFIILDENGKMLHVQQSDVLEEGKGYNLEKVKEFFNKWIPAM